MLLICAFLWHGHMENRPAAMAMIVHEIAGHGGGYSLYHGEEVLGVGEIHFHYSY